MTGPVLGGIINVAKPEGMTSFGVVARVRRLSGVRKVGHSGTLDPFAEGVLPILIGKATGMARYMDAYDKSYRVTVRFGAETDTQDRTGAVTGGRMPTPDEWAEYRDADARGFRDLLASLVGTVQQTPPMYSAVKINGKKLYQYARKGETVSRPSRTVTVYDARLVTVSQNGTQPELVADIDCSKGTYIRTLCQTLGERTGWGAHAEALVRTASGPFLLDQAIELDNLMGIMEHSTLDDLGRQGILLPPEHAIEHLPGVTLSRGDALRFIQGQGLTKGQALDCPSGSDDTRFSVYGPSGFVGIGTIRVDPDGGPELRAERVLANREDYLE